MGAAAHLERGLIVKRLKSGRRAKAERGGYATGAPAYGQQAVERELAEHPDEATTLEQPRAWHTEGVGVRNIARRLNNAGIPSKRGGRWHPTTVARLVNPEARAYARRQSASTRAFYREQTHRDRADRVLQRLQQRCSPMSDWTVYSAHDPARWLNHRDPMVWPELHQVSRFSG